MSKSQSSGTLQSPSTYSSSSKSGSNKSEKSATVDIDFTKDNAASPIDLECHIQAERITKILDEAIFKTKLALCLPNLVAEYKTLHSVLTPQHMDDLIFIFEQYENPLFSASLLNLEAMEDIKGGDVSLKKRLNPELSHLLHIMNSYPALKTKVNEMVEEMEAAYRADETAHKQMTRIMESGFHKWTSIILEPTNQGLEYLMELEQFRNLMVTQMATTAADDLAAKINARKLEASILKLDEIIREHSTSLKEEQEQFEKTMATKVQIVAKLEQELSLLNIEANVKMKKKILDSERQMVLASRSHVVKYKMLKEEGVELKDAYESALRQNLLDEKNLRARRLKVEKQLLSWIQKYDNEMKDKQEELDKMTEMYDDEVKLVKEWEAKLAEQDKEYIPLMAEREAEYHQEMTSKMEKFRHEHAARVIQAAWRKVMSNRAEKKKLRKLIKKKQEQQAAEAAAAEAEAKRQAAAEKKANKK